MMFNTIPLVLALTAPQNPTNTIEVLPLQHFFSDRSPKPHAIPWKTLLTRRSSEEHYVIDAIYDANKTNSLSPEIIVDLVSSFAGEEQLYLQPIGSNLLAVGTPETSQRAKSLLDAASRVMAHSIEVEFAAWDANLAETPPPIMGAEDYAIFANKHTPLWRSRNMSTAGRPLAIEHIKRSSYIRSIDVEVAQKQAITSPMTEIFSEGGCANVRAFSLIDTNDFAVFMQFAASTMSGNVVKLNTGMPETANVELPHLNSYFGTCSGRIPNGGALATSMIGDSISGGSITLTMRVTSKLSPQRKQLVEESSEKKSMTIFPTGVITTASLSRSLTLPPSPPYYHRHDATITAETSYGSIPQDRLHDLLLEVVHATDSDAELHVHDGYVYILGSQTSIGIAQQLLLSLQSQATQNAQVTHEAICNAANKGAHNLFKLRFSTLLGREAFIYRIRETNVIGDIYSEIASEASSLRPQTQLMQSGTWLRTRVTPMGKSLYVDMDSLSALMPVPEETRVMPYGVPMQPQSDTARNSYNSHIQPGIAFSHGDGPSASIDGQLLRSVITTTISR
jgi:hypothetical protein